MELEKVTNEKEESFQKKMKKELEQKRNENFSKNKMKTQNIETRFMKREMNKVEHQKKEMEKSMMMLQDEAFVV